MIENGMTKNYGNVELNLAREIFITDLQSQLKQLHKYNRISLIKKIILILIKFIVKNMHI